MTTESRDKHQPQVEVEGLLDLDPFADDTEAIRGGACQGPAQRLGSYVATQTQ